MFPRKAKREEALLVKCHVLNSSAESSLRRAASLCDFGENKPSLVAGLEGRHLAQHPPIWNVHMYEPRGVV